MTHQVAQFKSRAAEKAADLQSRVIIAKAIRTYPAVAVRR